ncbi:hypothetical protein CAI21_13840 [Alkalilimnicola ehrlichii]|uniref:Uncharacterized protein n=1 Tax=Alkalilimnicola ehrlichii TaxID=351052 RepID=A0A3E0WRP0_9GAMM|nr:hypothetical protein CAI21_13840 [Alkalilimnicola ehrlichii]RFA34645.1 hypothetical protein CAL65_14880 [Alkalilimnicola ehrlichii]
MIKPTGPYEEGLTVAGCVGYRDEMRREQEEDAAAVLWHKNHPGTKASPPREKRKTYLWQRPPSR